MARIPRSRLNGRPPAASAVSHAKTESDEPDDEVASSPGDDVSAGPPPVDALSEMLAGLSGASTSRITVYRIVKNQPPSYVFECDPSSFSMDDLRDKYNGGEFRLYIMKDGRLWKNMRVVVEPKQIFSGHDPAPPAQSHVSELMAMMRDGFASQAAALREALAARNGPSMFSGMDLPAVITAAAAAITALRPPPPPPAAPPPDTTAQAIDMFMRGMEIATNMRENAAPADNSIGGMLRDVLKSPVFAAAVQAAVPAPAPQAPIQRAANPTALPQPQPPQVSHAKTAAQPAQSQPQPDDDMLGYYLGFLCQKAAAGTDPVLYAELVLDNLSDDQLGPMLARGPLLIEDFIAKYPPVAEHRAWFEAMIQAVRDAMEATDDAPAAAGSEEQQHAVDPTPPVVLGDAP